MSNIFGILNTGKVALQTQQTGIDVTGHNIANVNTAGYSRQIVNMTATSSFGFQETVGTGVKITGISRAYDSFVTRQINLENQKSGYWEGLKTCLEQVEIVFNESGDYGLNQAMSDFWNAWNDVSNNPSGYVERISLLSKSSSLSMAFNETYANLESIRDNVSDNVASDLKQVNLMAGQVRDLNQQILQAEVAGSQANDLKDQRDLLLKDLSGIIDVETAEDQNGNVNVFVGGGHPLVSGTDTWQLETAPNSDPTLQDIVVWKDSDGSAVDITDKICGGEIKGMIEARDELLPDYLNRLNELAEGLITQVNTLHQAGDDLNGDSGTLFFKAPDPGAPAGFIEVNIEDPGLIAAAAHGAGQGDNSTALLIAGLQNELTMSGDQATFDNFYQSIVSDVGNSVNYTNANRSYQESAMTYLENYRESVSGVSTDEEMINLIKFQHAYEAAAKLIDTIDKMLDTLLGMS
jgi:flagellar hook-associated protein 1